MVSKQDMIYTINMHRRNTEMGNIKNILLHCQENEKEYGELDINPDDPGRLINRGWIEALQFVQEHFDIDLRTIQQKGK